MIFKKYILISFIGCFLFSCSSMDTKSISSHQKSSGLKSKRQPASEMLVPDFFMDDFSKDTNFNDNDLAEDTHKTLELCIRQRHSDYVPLVIMSIHAILTNRNPQEILNMFSSEREKDKFRDYLQTGNFSTRSVCSVIAEGAMSGASLYFQRRQNNSTYFDPIANAAEVSSFDIDTFINGIRERIASCSRPYESPDNVLQGINTLLEVSLNGIDLSSENTALKVGIEALTKFLKGSYDDGGDRDRYCRYYLSGIWGGIFFNSGMYTGGKRYRYLSKLEAEKRSGDRSLVIDERSWKRIDKN